MKTLPVVLFAALMALVCSRGSAAEDRPELIFRSYDLGALLQEVFPPRSVEPPFRIQVWVDRVGGREEVAGEKTMLRDCLREGLRGLGDVEFVDYLSKIKTASSIRVRVWFTKMEKPYPDNGFDTTVAVVVGKILEKEPMAEVVVDSFALAGGTPRDLDALCAKIIERLDLRVLSVLRGMNAAPKGQ